MRFIVPLILFLCLSRLDLSGSSAFDEVDTIRPTADSFEARKAKIEKLELEEKLNPSLQNQIRELEEDRNEILSLILMIFFLTFILAYIRV